jgi:alanyl-tRNA synthetase
VTAIDRLYYRDAYLTEFRAQVIDTAPGGRVYLDRTAFYPASGGQPYDTGVIGAATVTDVIDEGDRVAHVVSGEVGGQEVDCRVDWPRRFDHMQQHTGQHLLSAVLHELYGIATLSFHLGRDSSTIDVDAPKLDAGELRAASRRANALVFENRPVAISFEHAAEAQGLRKASEREGELRIVSIEGLDRSACGGTHVTRLGEIGPIAIRRLDRIRGTTRIEFLCGWRAIERAHADFDALARVAQVYSGALDDAPALVTAQQSRLADAERALRKLSLEMAQMRGRELHSATAPDAAAGNLRRVDREVAGALDDTLRAEAQSFAACGRAVYLAWSRDPASILLAVSADSGAHAGNLVKQALTAVGGRGGGSAQSAQGSVPDAKRLDQVLDAIRAAQAGGLG